MPTNPQLEIAFCADRNMLAALHVAAKSVMQHFTGIPRLLVLSDELGSADIDLCIKRFLILVRNMGSIYLRWMQGHLKIFLTLRGSVRLISAL